MSCILDRSSREDYLILFICLVPIFFIGFFLSPRRSIILFFMVAHPAHNFIPFLLILFSDSTIASASASRKSHAVSTPLRLPSLLAPLASLFSFASPAAAPPPSLVQICLLLQVCSSSLISRSRGPTGSFYFCSPLASSNFSFQSAAAPKFRAFSFSFSPSYSSPNVCSLFYFKA